MATETERDEGVRRVYKDHNLHVLWGVTLMAVLGTSSVTPAFPTIVRELGISSGQVGLLITFFTLPGIVMTPLLGILSDRYGRKNILVPALLLFGLAGGACAFARDFDLLLALRFFQGMGAAALGTLNVTVIGDIYDGRERSSALGYNSSVLSVGTASYPAIGGLLATLGWFYPFALPFAAIPIAIVVMFSLHNPEPRNDDRLRDYFGILLLACPFSCSPPPCSEWRKGSTSQTSSHSSMPTPPQRTAGLSWPRTVCPSAPARP